jgi:DNA-binding transcriptional regulator GbsR (MarR family)
VSDRATDQAELRFETLSILEELLMAFVERYGRRTTLGEVLAVMASLKRLCRQDSVTVAEIAEATGLPKQSLSRWAQKRVGSSIVLNVNDEDQRVHDVRLLDKQIASEPIARFARILKICDE